MKGFKSNKILKKKKSKISQSFQKAQQLTTRTAFYSVDEKEIDGFLKMFEQQGKYFRTLFNHFYWNPTILKDKEEMKAVWKKYCSMSFLFENKYCFATRYANSLFQEAKNKALLHQEENAFREKSFQDKLQNLEKQKVLLTENLKTYQKLRDKIKFKRTKTSLYEINRKIEKAQFSLKRLKTCGVTFGTKALQRKLCKKQTTLNNWKAKRNNFMYAIGRESVSCGNDSVKLVKLCFKDKALFQSEVKIELNKMLGVNPKNNKIRVVDKQYASFLVKNYYLDKELSGIKKQTQRIIFKSLKKYKKQLRLKCELHTTFEVSQEILPKEQTLGIDFNFGHLDYYLNEEINGRIEFFTQEEKELFNQPKNKNFLSTQQREEKLRKAIKQICLIAKQKECNINIENLNFNLVKNSLRKAKSFKGFKSEKGNKYNTMLSNLPYSKYDKIMSVECYKTGIFLRKVNPKNTSKDALAQGLERHLGAAMMISNK